MRAKKPDVGSCWRCKCCHRECTIQPDEIPGPHPETIGKNQVAMRFAGRKTIGIYSIEDFLSTFEPDYLG